MADQGVAPEFVPLPVAAQRLGVHPGRVFALITCGELRGRRNARGRWEISRASLDGLLEAIEGLRVIDEAARQVGQTRAAFLRAISVAVARTLAATPQAGR